MEADEPLQRLKSLQRDLAALAERQLANVDRLFAELDASIRDLSIIFEKRKRNDESRRKLVHGQGQSLETIEIDSVAYKINEEFRQAAIRVADELDLDELEAVKLCISAPAVESSHPDTTLPYRAMLQFHDHRHTQLDCLRLVLQQSVDSDEEEGEENCKFFREAVGHVLGGNRDALPGGPSSFWRKCIDGLGEVEASLKKVSEHKQTILMTGQALVGDAAEALEAQRLLLTHQHEALAAIMTYLIHGSHVKPEDFRMFLSKTASLESDVDISLHYLPIVISGSTFFGSDIATSPEAAHDLHKLFAVGPGQLQWKQPELKAAATASWLAGYCSRFADTHADPALRVADRQKAEEERSMLFFNSVKEKAWHFLLATCMHLRPEVWHDPAKVGLVRFLLSDSRSISADAPPASDGFTAMTMRELQAFTDAFVTNMPDVLRRLKVDQDGRRRDYLARSDGLQAQYEPDLERFIVIMSYAYQDDRDSAYDFWSDKESNLYGFLRWVSHRLPTPRVAAFCELLRSIAADPKNADHAHRFLLEDTSMVSGKLRKTYSVSWAQIFAELDTYATSFKDNVALPQPALPDTNAATADIMEPETLIMLEAYLRLAAHMCRTSPAARQWLLREQSIHLGDILVQLASSATLDRIQASCFDMLSAMLTDKTLEVNDGMWAMLDTWLTGGGQAARHQLPRRTTISESHYLARFNNNPETAIALVNLLTALVAPSVYHFDATRDALPFPENLGAPHRHGGIDSYVDFAMQAFRTWASTDSGIESDQAEILRCACLDFVCTCLTTFNENLVLLANVTSLPVDSAIETSSLAAYARLHPFARVMEWLFNDHIITALLSFGSLDIEYLNAMHPHSPAVQATFASVRAMNLALKLQVTYFDIVRPIIKTLSSQRSQPVANSAVVSFDEVLLSHMGFVTDIASFAASRHVDLGLESLDLLRRLAGSKKLADGTAIGKGQRLVGNPLIAAVVEVSDTIALELSLDFHIYEWDIETGQPPPKLIKATAVLDLLNSSLKASAHRLSIAHVLLGFSCQGRSVDVAPHSSFSMARSLFHAIAACAAQSPISVRPTNLSWLLSIKRGCLDVLLKLALSPLTSSIVLPELRSMEFLEALSKNQILATENVLWDMKATAEPDLLLGDSALAVRDFLRVRELFFEYAALEIRATADARMYSIQERAVGALLGVIRFPTGEQETTLSIFDLFDFMDLGTVYASEVANKYLTDLDLSVCMKEDPDTNCEYDFEIAKELLILRKRELSINKKVKDAAEDQQVDDEIRATLASLVSQNHFSTIEIARVEALEAWTDLLALLVTSGGLSQTALTALSLQGLQVALPKFEKALGDSLRSAALLARLTLTLVSATLAEGQIEPAANTSVERLLAAFRMCLKAITDSGTDLAVRDVCYRICCPVITAMPLSITNGKLTPSPRVRQLLQLVQGGGDRLMSVVTEDAFSGCGVTRVTAVLFLDALTSLFKAAKSSSTLLRALSKLNFMPVLIDTSIGSVASSFAAENEDLNTTLAYFHTALAFILRTCESLEGTQLVLNSGFFESVTDSRLFSTDPDIGLDIDNPVALREFYGLLGAVLRVMIAIVVTRGPSNAATTQQAGSFLQANRLSVLAVFKRTTAVQMTSSPPEKEAVEVAEEFARLMFVTGFLDDDESAQQRVSRVSGFT